MIRRILDLRRLKVPWPWLKNYQRALRSINNAIIWWEFWGSKLSDEMHYVTCPGCGVEIDLGAESWRRRDGPCRDGNYWCLGPYENRMPLGDYECCGCVPNAENERAERAAAAHRDMIRRIDDDWKPIGTHEHPQLESESDD